MKVLVNGGLNLSELDGWWAEAYSPEVGWAIGDRREHHDDPSWDAAEAEALYSLLEREVVAEFYLRDERGIPRGWVARMRESMARLTPTFSTNRVVRQYTEGYYLQAAAAFHERAANRGLLGAELLRWQAELAKHWSTIRFGSAKVDHHGEHYTFQAQAFVGNLDPEAVMVELFADGQNGGAPERHVMRRGQPVLGFGNGFEYIVQIPSDRPAADYTPRLIPARRGAFVPLETPYILWHEAPGWREASR
jgi:glycogen phosphorylase